MDWRLHAEPRAVPRPKSSVRRLDQRLPEFGRDYEIAASLSLPSVEAYWSLSDDQRAWHESRWAERRERCGHCGLPRSTCSDPGHAFYPQREICYATMERMAADAAYSRLHEDRPWHDGSFRNWSPKPSREFPYHFTYGVTVGVSDSDLRPWDDFLKRESASPIQSDTDSDDEPEQVN